MFIKQYFYNTGRKMHFTLLEKANQMVSSIASRMFCISSQKWAALGGDLENRTGFVFCDSVIFVIILMIIMFYANQTNNIIDYMICNY